MRSPLKLILGAGEAGDGLSRPSASLRLAYDQRAFGDGGPSADLQSQFPSVAFTPINATERTTALARSDLVIVSADAGRPNEVDALCAALRDSGRAARFIIFLGNADLSTVRRVMREGAGDVLPVPVGETTLAASLERIIAKVEGEPKDSGQSSVVIALLKAGGGVGATALGSQLSALIADIGRGPRVCMVDLDLQFGSAAMYLDLPSSVTLAEVMSAGTEVSEMSFTSSLAAHASGARVLGAPAEFTPLDALTPNMVDGLITALKREFDVIILDLPSAWTAWTYRALRQSDKIVLITQLTVPHAHLAKRQLTLLESQRLGDVPVVLVCNRCGGDNPPGVSIKAVESAIGRGFDVQIPEERKLMNEAINQGVALSTIRRGSKIEKALGQLAAQLVPTRAVSKKAR